MGLARKREFRVFLYCIVLISSVVLFGIIAEACDITGRCGSRRLKFLLGAGVCTAVISIAAIALHLLNIWSILRFETILAVLLFVLFVCICGVIASPRTLSQILAPDLISLPAILFRVTLISNSALAAAWVGLSAAALLVFLSLIHKGWSLAQHKDDVGTSRKKVRFGKLGSNRHSDEGTTETVDDVESGEMEAHGPGHVRVTEETTISAT